MVARKTKRLFILVNSKSGKATTQGIKLIRDWVGTHSPRSVVKNIQSPSGIRRALESIKTSQFDAIAVYAGDGTVLTVVKQASERGLPVLILPGGTANALATDFGLPGDVEACLELYRSGKYRVATADIGEANGKDFVLDLHYGVWAEAIETTPTVTKKRFGQLAYAIEAMRALRKTSRFRYEIELDGRKKRIKGYALMVANGGFQNVFGLPLFPRAHQAGKLHVAVIRTARLSQLLRWYFLRRLGRKRIGTVIATYKVSSVIIHKAPERLIFDDEPTQFALPLEITNTGRVAKIIAPREQTT